MSSVTPQSPPAPAPSPAKIEGRLIGGAVGAITAAVLAVYANSLNAPFLFDDFPAIVRNTTIRDLGNFGAVLTPPLDGAGVTGRPLVNLSFALNYALGGLDVRGYHAGSVLLHLATSLLFFGVLRRTFLLSSFAAQHASQATVRAGCIALLWAVHPLLTESVVCVVQRNEVMVGLFCFAVFYGFVRSVDGSRGGRGWQVLAVVSSLLGMATKEVMATVPLLILLYDRTFVAGTFAQAWRARKFFYAALAATWLLLAFLMIRSEQRAGIVGFGLGMSAWDYLVTQCRALVLYLQLALWPHPLVIDYGPVIYQLSEVWREAIAVVTFGLVVVWALWRRPRWGFVGAWFFVILGPSSSFVPLTTQTIAEHRMYLPLAAVMVALVVALERVAARRFVWVCLALAVGAGVLTVRRNAEYRDELTFWQKTIRHQPDNARVHASLGYYYLRNGMRPEAIAAYRRATELRANFADAHSDLGTLLLEEGRVSEALVEHRRAVAIKPADAAIRFNFGVALERAGDMAGATAQWREAVRLRPTLAPVQRKLGWAELALGRPAVAREHFRAALQIEPDDAEAMAGAAQAALVLGDRAAAMGFLVQAIDRHPAVAELHYNLANLRLEDRDWSAAIAGFEEALRTKPAFSYARHNLALALTNAGRAGDALVHYEQVRRELPDSAAVCVNYAYALEATGRRREALALLREARQLDPGSVEAREQERRLEQLLR
ncbi:MAG: tetratricopeptide repeat protein [Candidatus Didemnitutus sp.]|nr:tetratricopeptide repeat protein [Candidatus Didemnitutus sp.]